MKKLLLTLAALIALYTPALADDCAGPFRGLVYYTNPVTGGMRLYLSFELEPDHLYKVDVTTDGTHYETIELKDTTGATVAVYESFSVDPCDGIWPRVIDLGPTLP